MDGRRDGEIKLRYIYRWTHHGKVNVTNRNESSTFFAFKTWRQVMMRIRNGKNFHNFFYKNENVTTELPFSLTVHVGGMGLYYPSSQ